MLIFFFFYPFFKKFVSLCCDRFKKYKQAGSHSTSFRLTNGRTDDTGVCVRERDPFHMSGFQLGSMEILINWKYRSELFFFFYCYGQCWTLRKLWKVCKAPSSAVDFIYFFFKILYRFSMHVYIVMPCYVLVKCLRRGIKWVLTVFPCKDVHRVDDRIVSALHFPLLLWQF